MSKTLAPTFFKTPAEFRAWLKKHHKTADEIIVGYYRKSSGKPSITWQESVDEALCFGWIDGIRKSIDDESYMNRLTPRRKGSNWSAINIKRVKELTKLGLMKPAGLKAFEARDPKKANQYSFERDKVEFTAPHLKQFKANKKAWAFFQKQPPGYRKIATWYVMSAKLDATRDRRLAHVIAVSEREERLAPMQPASERARK